MTDTFNNNKLGKSLFGLTKDGSSNQVFRIG